MTEKKEAARIARNRYMREWRAKNPDKAKAIRERYWEKKAMQAEREEGNDCERQNRVICN